MSVTEFNNIFDRLYRFQTTNEDIKSAGLKIIYNPGHDMAVKIDITYKMLVIHPKDVYLHYVMGCMYKDTQRFHALSWFRKCYEIEPLYIENLIDMLKILFDTDCFVAIQNINTETNNFLYTSTDVRLMLLVSAVEAKLRNFEKSIDLLKTILAKPDLSNDIRFLCLSFN